MHEGLLGFLKVTRHLTKQHLQVSPKTQNIAGRTRTSARKLALEVN